jgi:hypothetical protein
LQAVVGNKRTVAVVIVRIYNYLCNQCLSQLKLWVWITLMASWTRYNIMWYSLSVTYDRFLPPITLTSSLEARNYIFLVTKIDWLVFQLLSWSEHETKIHVSIVKKEALIWTYGRIYRLSQTKQDIVYTVERFAFPRTTKDNKFMSVLRISWVLDWFHTTSVYPYQGGVCTSSIFLHSVVT